MELNLTKEAYKRWSPQDEETLISMFTSGREEGIPHKQLWGEIALVLDRSPTEVQRKLIRMYKGNEDLQKYKQEDWSKEKVLDQLKSLYLDNQQMNKNSLPEKLKFILLKNKQWFDSPDHALSEAVLSAGYCRNEDGTLDKDSPIQTIEDALEYVRLGHKKRHVWNLDEVKGVLSALHEADYPITLPFLTNHYNIYKSALGVNRKLESFKDVIKKFVEDGSIKSYPNLVCTIAPEYIAYYNPEQSRLRLSTEEIRVKKFLDRYKISYVIPRLSDKIPTGLETFANFVPDFIIVDGNKNPLAIVEVFGSIGDRENAGVNEIYADKTKAKLDFYKTLPLKFIEVYNNGDRCDLDDSSLLDRLGSFISFGTHTKQASKNKLNDLKDLIKIQCTDGNWNYDPYMQGLANGMILSLTVLEDLPANFNPPFKEAPSRWLSEKYDLQDLVTSSIDKTTENLEKYGCAIVYSKHNKNYTLISKGAQDFKFDSLFQIPKLTPKNPALKEVIHRLIDKQKTHKERPLKYPTEQTKDYQPFTRPIDYDTDLSTSIPENTSGSGIVG